MIRITGELVKNWLPEYKDEFNKGDMGRVFLVGGSEGMTGAVCLGAEAALKSGAGLVTVGIPRSLNPIIEVKLTEAMSLPLTEDSGLLSSLCIPEVLDFAKKCNSVAVGPGARQGEGVLRLVEALIENFEGSLLIDADGLNVLAQNLNVLKNKAGNIVLTPHPGEMSRLTGLSIDEIQADREKIARQLASAYGITVLLKGHGTVIATPDKVYINTTGNPGMATGGSGDVLTGIILAFCGMGLGMEQAAACGAYLHGLAGDFAAEEKTKFCVVASDITNYLPRAFGSLED